MDDYTFRYKEDGVLLNSDVSLPFVDITRVEGLSSAPGRITERDREGQDGGFVDAEFEKIRTVIVEGTVYADTSQIETFMDELKKNYALSKASYPFYFRAPGTNDRVVFCKSYGLVSEWGLGRRIGEAPFQVTLVAEDPRIYDAVPVSDSTELFSGDVEGYSYNKAYNYGYGTPIFGGNVSLYNAGNRDTGATITIRGPIDNPVVEHDETARHLEFEISLAYDQYLVIDLRKRSVLLNGATTRRSTMTNTSRWFMLQPGVNNLRFQGSDPISGDPDPIMTVEMRGAYR